MSANKKKQRNTPIKPYLVFVLLVSAVIVTILCAAANIPEPEHYIQNVQTISDGYVIEDPTDGGSESSVIPEKTNEIDWRLILVNKWNPLPEGHSIETIELSNGERVDKRIYEPLARMFRDMEADGVYPIVVSGYRTWQDQEQIMNDKIAAYEAEGMSSERARQEAERWVAIPGTSEHQLGLAVDINADGIHSAGYEVYGWLAGNAHKYGFIKRYPSNKTRITGISNEPWHYRYVGEKTAAEIYRQGVCLEEYLSAMDERSGTLAVTSVCAAGCCQDPLYSVRMGIS